MVKINTLLKKKRITKINDLEVARYVNFFENSYRDNLNHSIKNLEEFPRWSIISGYYAMHDLTKLFFAKEFRIKVDFKVHQTTVELLNEIVNNKEISSLLEKAHREFLSLANDLDEAMKERTKVQYYTGTAFLKKEYQIRAREFNKKIVLPFINKIKRLLI